jgi:intracellular multiplication protein IcmJ
MSICAARLDAQPVLGVKRKVWRQDDEHAAIADEKFGAVRQSVLQRDHHACRFCDQSFIKWLEVHHRDDDHTNQSEDNLVTACGACHQVHHLGMAGLRSSGFLAAIPELTQTEVIAIVRNIFAFERVDVQAVPDKQAICDKLKGFYAVFQQRGGETLKRLFGELGLDISSPMAMAQVLSAVPEPLYAARVELLASIRLVPTREAFRTEQLDMLVQPRDAALRNPGVWRRFAGTLLSDTEGG